ncbi:hypothetical protein CBOM_05229 [Ceraceosorus bombacis]|uniref:Uncharacterized protein n=1 Tax=Ceraceosorus bombacis TaxID=401625 RepID=A0A0N7LB62_9BASI|nr:hypothetical protein CBOM_05229 [Ceraceosorus bombacis]
MKWELICVERPKLFEDICQGFLEPGKFSAGKAAIEVADATVNERTDTYKHVDRHTPSTDTYCNREITIVQP